MIDINTLPDQLHAQLRNDPLIYVAANQKQVPIPHFSTIVLAKDVTEVLDVLPRYHFESGYHPFFLQHTDLFREGQTLFREVFGVEPDRVLYSYKADHTASIFLFFNSELIEKALKGEGVSVFLKEKEDGLDLVKILHKESDRLGVKIDNITKSDDGYLLSLPDKAFPVIGALNSLRSGWRKPNFNLIFGTDYSNAFDYAVNDKVVFLNQVLEEEIEKQDWISNLDDYFIDKFTHGMSLYSIDKFDLGGGSDSENERLFDTYDPYDMTKYYQYSCHFARKRFKDTILQFTLAINRGKHLPLSSEEFSAVIPHFYEFDRLAESVANYDESDRRKLKRLYDSSLRYAQGNTNLTFKTFIDYFLKDSVINFENLKSDPTAEMLKALKQQPQIPYLIGRKKEILTRFIEDGAPNSKCTQFIRGEDGQLEGKRKAYQYL